MTLGLELVNVTTNPADGAGALNDMVPVTAVLDPPTTELGEKVTP